MFLGTLAGLIPSAAGIGVFLDPLRRKSDQGGFTKLARLSDIPADGTPRLFPVVATKTDVWNKIPAARIGAVYLRRDGDKISALNVSCPHAGCAVDFRDDLPPNPQGLPVQNGYYFCPCHNSSFSLDGGIKDKKSPAKRPLDSLEVEIRGEEVFVKYQNFIADKSEKVPVT